MFAPNTKIDGLTGDSVHLREIAENLSRLDHEIIVICNLRNSYHNISGIEVKKISFPFIAPFVGGIITCIKILLVWKPDAIYVRGLNLGGAFLFRLFKSKIIVEINEILGEEIKISKESIRNNRIDRFIWRKLLNRVRLWSWMESIRISDKVITVTPNIKEYILKNYSINNDDIEVISNGANTSIFRPMEQNNARERLSLDRNALYTCFVGNLVEWQGVEILINAIPSVLNECSNARFLILGDGPLRNDLEILAKALKVYDKIDFKGFVQYLEVPFYINSSNLCVAPFIKDRNQITGLSPLKVYEYLSCGKPVISSNISGIRDIFDESKCGFLVEPEESTELAKAIVRMLKNKDLQSQMGLNGRRYIVENHSWTVAALKVSNICNRLKYEAG